MTKEASAHVERALGEQEAGRWQAGSQEISMLPVSWAWSFSRSLSRPQLPDRLGRWADGVLPGEGWGDSRYWGLLDSTLKPTSLGVPLGLLAPGSVQWPSAHFGGLLLGLEEAGPPQWVLPQ